MNLESIGHAAYNYGVVLWRAIARSGPAHLTCGASPLLFGVLPPDLGMAHSMVTASLLGGAVLAAVLFLGEHLTAINCVGLVVLVLGVALFNYTKYKKVITGQAMGTRTAQGHEKGELRAERHEAHDGERACAHGQPADTAW